MSSPSSTPAPSSITPPPSNPRSSSSFDFASLRARQVTGTHLLRIDGYTAADRLVLAGNSIDSRAFSAGGRKWQLCYYPNGHDSEKPGPPSVELKLKDRSSLDEVVMASYRLSIIDGDGNPARSCAVGPQRFEWPRWSHGVIVQATPEERQAVLRLVDDDSLTVRCDVSVTRFDKESRIKYYLRKLLD